MTKAPPLRLGVNVDHVATLRNARGGARPDPVRAALTAIEAGADGITAHLREDRRHIRDADMARLKAEISKPLNFEMAATPDMLGIALATKPHAVCLVPERREELTTEGGLDVVGQHNVLKPFIAKLSDAGVRVSLFIAADPRQIEMAASLRAPVIEIHTGAWCDAVVDGHTAKAAAEWQRIVAGVRLARSAGLEVHAGHGLDYATAEKIAALTDAGVRVSLFIAADPRQIEMAANLRAPVIEIHTGAWCDAVADNHAAKAEAEWQRIVAGAGLASSAGLEVHAGHGLDYATAETIAGLPEIVELNIGYYMMGEALFVGLGETVRAMRAAMDRGRRNLAGSA